MHQIAFTLRGEHIALDALLKATGLAESGGRAKTIIASGAVAVDARTELRRACKIRAGQCVALRDVRIEVHGPGAQTVEPASL